MGGAGLRADPGGHARPQSVVAATQAPTRADTWLERAPRAAVDREWRRARPRTLLERRLVDGRVGLSVQADDDVGFRVWAPRHGCYLVAPDGRRVLGAPPAGPAWRWERLVLAQVLPLAAVLRGMDVFHASAVALAGRAIAFLGGSGAGKTTLASRIVARGARLVTDDVLAIEATATTIRAHRGGGGAHRSPRAAGADALRAPHPRGGAGARREVAPHAHARRGAASARPHLPPRPPRRPARRRDRSRAPLRPRAADRQRLPVLFHRPRAPAAPARVLRRDRAQHPALPGPCRRRGATSADVADAVLRHAEVARGERARRDGGAA